MEERFVLRGGVAPFAQNESQSHFNNSLRRGIRDFDFVARLHEGDANSNSLM